MGWKSNSFLFLFYAISVNSIGLSDVNGVYLYLYKYQKVYFIFIKRS